jgi:hypothetical protein
VCLVYDHGEALAGQFPHLFRDNRKFLERSHNDCFARLERFLELARSGVDVLYHAERLLKLTHSSLELAIEDAPIRNDDDGVEHALIGGVVERRELVGEPSDGETLATSRRMLNQVPLTCTRFSRMRHELANSVELLIAGEDQEAFASFPAPLVLFLYLLNELAHEIEHAVACPGFLPQITGGVALLCRRHRRISSPAELPSVEGQEARLRPSEMRRHIDQVRINRKMCEAAAETQ